MLPSTIFRWNGAAFEPFQTLEGKGGRAFLFFAGQGEAYLAFAKILGDTLVYRWNGTAFVEHQTLSGPGGREFAYLEHKGERYVIQVNFITGTPASPNTALAVRHLPARGRTAERRRHFPDVRRDRCCGVLHRRTNHSSRSPKA